MNQVGDSAADKKNPRHLAGEYSSNFTLSKLWMGRRKESDRAVPTVELIVRDIKKRHALF